MWAGRTFEPEGWRCTSDTTAAQDLQRARIVIAGMAAEMLCKWHRPASSLDELALSQYLAGIAQKKIETGDRYVEVVRQGPWRFADEAAHKLWNEQVWHVALKTIKANRYAFKALTELLYERGKLKGAPLQAILQRVQPNQPINLGAKS
jgi:hypothetical protein